MRKNLRKRIYVAAAMLGAVMVFSSAAQAMTIVRFDKMADEDQARYIGDLIVGAQNVLNDAGKPALAAQVKQLFTTKLGNDADTVGMVEFERNLARARVADLRRLDKDPRAPRLEVEDAMAVTLEKNGIPLPDTFFTVASEFRPKYPPKR